LLVLRGAHTAGEDGRIPPVELLSGDPSTRVLLHVPHAGTRVPGWLRSRLLLSDAEMAAEIDALTDHRTDVIALRAADLAVVRPFVLVNHVSRFVVDPERFLDEREEMAAVGMGAVYTHGTRGQRIRADDPVHAEALLDAFYRPWADATEAAVRERLAATGRAVLLDVHSYPREPLPYERHAHGPRPATCLGTDVFHTPPWLVDAAREALAPVGDVALNSPFAGTYVPLSRYGTDPRVASLMLELRRDVCAESEPALARALAALVNALS
jgi:N-formylglutamate deformylase